jgi:hypothetical protein
MPFSDAISESDDDEAEDDEESFRVLDCRFLCRNATFLGTVDLAFFGVDFSGETRDRAVRVVMDLYSDAKLGSERRLAAPILCYKKISSKENSFQRSCLSLIVQMLFNKRSLMKLLQLMGT